MRSTANNTQPTPPIEVVKSGQGRRRLPHGRTHRITASAPVELSCPGTAHPPVEPLQHAPTASDTAVVPGGADEDDGVLLVDLCGNCGSPNHPYTARIPLSVRLTLPLGPNGGVLIWRRVPGTAEWIEIEYLPPDDEHDDYRPVEPLLPLKVAAIVLGLRVKTLYDRAHCMASSEKHGRLWFFKRDLLLAVDAVSEAGPSRAEILAEREERRARGEVRRAGSHHPECDRRHEGPCAASRRTRPSERDRARVRRSILDDLGA
jgi:hypothetical protein